MVCMNAEQDYTYTILTIINLAIIYKNTIQLICYLHCDYIYIYIVVIITGPLDTQM